MKTNILKVIAIALVWMASAFVLPAQTNSFEEVLQVQLRNMGTINEGSEIKGYYMFYKEDKIDRKTNLYRLRILDNNLKEVAAESITGSKYLALVEGCFNGENLLMKFIDFKEGKFSYRIYDKSAKLVKEFSHEAEKWEMQLFASAYEKGEIMEASIFGVPNQGFINIRMMKEKKVGYKIQYYAKDRRFLGWDYKSSEASKMHEGADFITCDENLLIVQIIKRKGALSNEMDSYLLGIDIKTGKKKFENPMKTAEHSMFMLNGLADKTTGNYFMFGQFSELGDNSLKDNSLGFCGVELDGNGKTVASSLVFWDKDVSKFLPVNYKGKIDDIGYVFFHKIVRTADGKVYAIGEQYKKAVSALGLASQALGGGASAYKMVIKDMMIFQFSPDFKLEGVSVFEKGKTNVSLPQGAGINGPQVLAYYIMAYGGFDYSYTQVPNDNKSFTVCVQDWEKEKGEKGRMTFKSISLAGDDYVTDKIDLMTESTLLNVMPAKPGYVLISEYYRKLKKIDLRLEKFNR